MSVQTFVLPDLGEGLTEAEIVRWLVTVGDVVTVDQSIVEVETAKSVVEVPTPYAGRVETLHAAEGATLDVGRPLISVAGLDAAQPSTAREGEAYREEEKRRLGQRPHRLRDVGGRPVVETAAGSRGRVTRAGSVCRPDGRCAAGGLPARPPTRS